MVLTGLAGDRAVVSICKQPLLHFLLVGAVLFGAYAWMNRATENPRADRAQQIQVGAGDVQWLAENWTTQWRRPPTHDELRGLIADYLNEQLLAREARASYQDFCEARSKGDIVKSARFQVCLPTPMGVIYAFCTARDTEMCGGIAISMCTCSRLMAPA